MKIEIKHRITGRVLFSLETESLKLCVEAAVKSKADLMGADLMGADLMGADLRDANGVNKLLCTPLAMLFDQPGKIRAYKLVTAEGNGPYNGGIIYEVGKTYSVENADCTEEQCAAGINLATLDWCMRYWQKGYRILVAEFEAQDIASIPISTDGKFRVHRCSIVGEKDLKELGFVGNEK